MNFSRKIVQPEDYQTSKNTARKEKLKMSQTMMVLASAHGGPLFSIGGLEVSSITTTTWGIMAILTLVCVLATRDLQIVPVRKGQIAVELAVDSLITFLGSIMGGEEKAKKYFPLLGSLFFIILI